MRLPGCAAGIRHGDKRGYPASPHLRQRALLTHPFGKDMLDDAARQLLRDMFDAAIAAAQPALTLPTYLPQRPKGRTIVIGAGKASAAMAHAFEQAWGAPVSGLVVTRYGYAVPCKQIRIVEAAHPVPDAAGHQAAHEISSWWPGSLRTTWWSA
jgi:glycerate-2-kinase